MSPVSVRPAEPADLGAVAAIYAHSVRTSTATFDDQEPPLSYWQAKLDSTSPGDHFLVACSGVAPSLVTPGLVAGDDDRVDGVDRVLGYACSGSYRARPAYRLTRESSVYVSPEATGRGLGSQLYAELLRLLGQDEMHLVVAVVSQPNPASNALHRRMGFTEVGTLDEVGFKFGAFVSTTTFQLRLG